MFGVRRWSSVPRCPPAAADCTTRPSGARSAAARASSTSVTVSSRRDPAVAQSSYGRRARQPEGEAHPRHGVLAEQVHLGVPVVVVLESLRPQRGAQRLDLGRDGRAVPSDGLTVEREPDRGTNRFTPNSPAPDRTCCRSSASCSAVQVARRHERERPRLGDGVHERRRAPDHPPSGRPGPVTAGSGYACDHPVRRPQGWKIIKTPWIKVKRNVVPRTIGQGRRLLSTFFNPAPQRCPCRCLARSCTPATTPAWSDAQSGAVVPIGRSPTTFAPVRLPDPAGQDEVDPRAQPGDRVVQPVGLAAGVSPALAG